MNCPACNSTRRTETRTSGVYTCRKCGCLFGQTYLGESYALVDPSFASAAQLATAEAAGTVRGYDLMCLGSAGITRRHGFYDTVSRRITQTG